MEVRGEGGEREKKGDEDERKKRKKKLKKKRERERESHLPAVPAPNRSSCASTHSRNMSCAMARQSASVWRT